MVRVAAALLEYSDAYVFMIRTNPPFENLLNLIGGRLEGDESAHDGIVREIQEETGCDAQVVRVGSIDIEYEGFDTFRHELYIARTRTEPRTTAPEEGAIVLRAKSTLVQDPDLHELHRYLIDLMREGTPFVARARIGPAPTYALRTFEFER